MESFIQLDNFYLQSVSLATMGYCAILYLVATVIRMAELKKCLMVMFGMDLIVRIGVMTAGCILVTDMKMMCFFLFLQIISSLIIVFISLPATPVFHVRYKNCLKAVFILFFVIIVIAGLLITFKLYLQGSSAKWGIALFVLSLQTYWLSIFDLLTVWNGNFGLGESEEEKKR
ncbi:hypothetical protein GCK72_003822 [Caenorhabditis remanei]|uniref:Uncharacterized protein n=1 Tax=Caenorhabditis remanei TaxID=31234 RepID=A0A6A5HAK3_CAERE|nr:hypothetical protein GCK72_003822 [Caenorhabditis remanei]KAF1763876.1 hypothetical protein GCK72_003822 [Caenorhabditis remanei]